MITVVLPIKTRSEANMRSHYMARARRARDQRETVLTVLRNKDLPSLLVLGPVRVTLERCAPSAGLDDDNLRSALKFVRDGVADALGISDRDPRVTWHYAQRRGPRGSYAVRITLEGG